MNERRGWKGRLGTAWDTFFPRMKGPIQPAPDRITTVGCLAKNPDFSMEIALRLYDEEVRRRQSADTKAAAYLAFLAVVVPVIGTFTPTISERLKSPILALDMAVLALALVYVLMAGWYASRASKPSKVHQTEEGDLATALGSDDAKAAMAAELIDDTLSNYPLNNEKISYVRLAQAHIFRAFVAIMAFVAIEWLTVASVAFEKPDEQNIDGIPPIYCANIALRPVTDSRSDLRVLRFRLSGNPRPTICLPLTVGLPLEIRH